VRAFPRRVLKRSTAWPKAFIVLSANASDLFHWVGASECDLETRMITRWAHAGADAGVGARAQRAEHLIVLAVLVI
jgi:hypothetical protein